LENNLKVLLSDKFAVQNTASLSLFLYPSSLHVFARDKNQSITAIHSYERISWKKLDEVLASDSLTKLDVPAKVYVHEELFTLLPGVIFQQGSEKEYLQLAGKLPATPYFFHSAVDSNNVQMAKKSGSISLVLIATWQHLRIRNFLFSIDLKWKQRKIF